MRLFFTLLLLSTATQWARADDWVSSIDTDGTGNLEVVTDYWIFSSSKTYYGATIPGHIETGTSIRVSFVGEDGKPAERTFSVATIEADGPLCHVYDPKTVPYTTKLGDTIHIHQCRHK